MLQLHTNRILPIIIGLLLFSCLIISCGTNKKTVSINNDKVLLAERSAGWLKYKVYLLPVNDSNNKKMPNNMRLSIMVINIQDNTSPLRKICTDLNQYNTYYEYLLNKCKEDLQLCSKGEILYPISYSFENNYNAFPFETINVGYKYDLDKKKNKRMQDLKLKYTDRVFAQDTLTFYLNNKK